MDAVESPLADTPSIGGDIDAAYLAEALARAGRPNDVGEVLVAPIDEGRSSAAVFSLKTARAGDYVVKVLPGRAWWSEMSGVGCVEAELWASGTTRALPPPLVCPTIDLAFNAGRGEYFMLMDDVSPAIVPRGGFDEQRTLWLFDGLAHLHAHYWESDVLGRLPVWSMADRAGFFAGTAATAAGRAVEPTGFFAIAQERVPVFRWFVPTFLDLVGPDGADFYLALCTRPEAWLAALERLPMTLNQGDPRRANFAAFSPERVSLFDWDFAVVAPAASDIAWFWFLQFWCYPPGDGKSVADREPLRAAYCARLERALGESLDREGFDRAFDLSWLLTFAEIGCVLADRLSQKSDAEERAGARRLCRSAVDEARRICEAHVR